MKIGKTLPIIVSLFIAALLLYLPLTADTLQASDAGELVTGAVLPAVLHPPGFPVYSWISHLLVSLFPGEPIQTLAVFSVVCQGIAAVIFFLLLSLITKELIFSGLLALSWLLYSPTVRTATDVEVFALHHILIVLLVLVCFRAIQQRDSLPRSLIFLTGLLCGLGGSHHTAIVFWAPLVIAVLVTHCNRERIIHVFGLLGIGVLIGLLPYLSLLYRFEGSPALGFQPPETLSRLVQYMLRSDYGTFSLAPDSGVETVSYFWHFFKMGLKEVPVFVIASLVAVFLLFQKGTSKFFLGVVGSLFFHLWFVSKLIMPNEPELYNEIVLRFYPLVMLCFGITAAIVFLRLTFSKPLKIVLAVLIIAPVLIHLPATRLGANCKEDRIIDFELETILREVPENGVFITNIDRLSMGLQFKRYVENKRPDLVLVIEGLWGKPDYVEAFQERHPEFAVLGLTKKEALRALVETAQNEGRGVFSYRHIPPPEGYFVIPAGLTWQWHAPGTEFQVQNIASDLLRFCSEWEEAIFKRNPYRDLQEVIRNRVFLAPYQHFVKSLPDSPYTPFFQTILSLQVQGDAQQAISLCQRERKKLAL